MRIFLALILSLFLSGSINAQTPTPEDLNKLITEIEGIQKQREELTKKVADLLAQADQLMKTYQKRLADAGGVVIPPPGPAPTDPLKLKIVAAFASDPGDLGTKKTDAAKLSGIYSAAVSKKVADNKTIETAGQLIEQVRGLGEILPASRLPETRKVIGAELKLILGDNSTKLTEESRKACHALFAKVEAILDEVMK